jgi:hypothetical protein
MKNDIAAGAVDAGPKTRLGAGLVLLRTPGEPNIQLQGRANVRTDHPSCLFLSHSGADTNAARELKRRLLDSPDAQVVGLRVWLEKDDLAAGVGW